MRSPHPAKSSVRKFALFIDSPTGKRLPVKDGGGVARGFGSEREAQEAIARIGLRKLRAFLRREIDFDEALMVEEYYLPVRAGRDGTND